jgi:penicillin-binding protein 2
MMKIRTDNIFKGNKRYIFVIVTVIFFSLLIISRLFYLQINKGEHFLNLSERNILRTKRIPPLRGIIYDKNSNIVAENRPGFSLFINRLDIKKNNVKLKNVLRIISKISNVKLKKLNDIIKKHKKEPLYEPIKLISNIDWKTLGKIETYGFFIPGITIDFDPVRFYPLKEAAAHIIGYVLEADKNDIKKYKSLRPGDYTGKAGIEKLYNRFLIGKSGKKIIEVDAKGRELRVLSQILPESGYSLVLNIRNDLQKFAYKLMKNRSGAIISMDPNNGEILCLVSSPSYNPNDFSKGISSKEWNDLINNKLKPLSNKAIGGLYPPGSTFKIITAATGLLNNKITVKDKFFCTGVYKLGNAKYRCWKKFGHGEINIVNAIKESCDIFFYKLGVLVGVDNIYKVGSLFGLGYNTGIDLPGEKAGLLPSKEWKEKAFHQPWYPGETPPVAIGQGYTLVTPLQMLVAYSAVANGGKIFEPHIVNKIVDSKGNIIKEITPKVLRKLKISKEKLDIIRLGLKKVVNEIHGTAYSQRIKGFEFSGKTGTAQVKKMGEIIEKDINKIPYEYRDHAWFVAYAPSDNPKFAVVVLVEHGGHGGSGAAPLARKIIKYFFKIKED